MADGFWLWSPEADSSQGVPTGERRFFRKTVELAEVPARATIEITADDRYVLFVNGAEVGTDDDWQVAETYEVAEKLRVGRNVIAVQAENHLAGPAGLFVRVRLTRADGGTERFDSDHTWRVATQAEAGWTAVEYDDSTWVEARELGPKAMAPWGGVRNELPRPMDEIQAANLAAYRRLARTQAQQAGRNLVPRPQEFEEGEGSVLLVQAGKPCVDLVACYIDEQEMFAGRLFQAALEELTGATVAIRDAAVTPVQPGQVWIVRAKCGALPKEAKDLAERTWELSPQSYALRVHQPDPRPLVLAVGGEDPGVVYAVHTLVQLLQIDGRSARLPAVRLTDWPDTPLRGVVGGTTVEDLAWLSFYKHNAMVFGLGHAEPLSPDLAELTDYARRWGVQMVGFWHVPQDFCYADKEAVAQVTQRVLEAIELGFRAFSINADDFPDETITDADKNQFGPGLVGLLKAQTALLRAVSEEVGGTDELWFCPRVYYDVRRKGQEPTEPDADELAYRTQLGDLPPPIVLWTTQPKEDYLRETVALWRRKPMLWHNYFLEFSQCGARYFEGYPAVPRGVLEQGAGWWTEGDQFQGHTRVNYATHAAAVWNCAQPVSLREALAREFGAPAGAALWAYAQHLGASETPRGRLADHWDQPDDFPAKLFGTGWGGSLPRLPPGADTARDLRRRADAAAQARAIDFAAAGLPEELARTLRADAEKIELNFRIFAALAEGLNADRRAEIQAAAARLKELGAAPEYLGWLAERMGK